jgi:hypothetical protein
MAAITANKTLQHHHHHHHSLLQGLTGLGRHVQKHLGEFRGPSPVLFVSNPICNGNEYDCTGTDLYRTPRHQRRQDLQQHSLQEGEEQELETETKKRKGGRRREMDQAAFELSDVSRRAHFLLGQRCGLRLLAVEQAFPFPSQSQVHQVLDLSRRLGSGSVVVGVGSGSAIDLAAAAALRSGVFSESPSLRPSQQLVLVPATYASVMVAGAAAASASSGMVSVGSPLLLDDEEATLVRSLRLAALSSPPSEPQSTLAAATPLISTSIVQLESRLMCRDQRDVALLAATSLVLDRLRTDCRPPDEEEGDDKPSNKILDSLLSFSHNLHSDNDRGEKGLWDVLFEVGARYLAPSSHHQYRTTPDRRSRRPVPLALAASLAPTSRYSVPEIMAGTVPHLVRELLGGENRRIVDPDRLDAIERLVRDSNLASIVLDPPAEEHLSVLRSNQLLNIDCRDDDAFLRRIVADLVVSV